MFLDLCERYFNTRDLFEVLQIERDASEREVRKAYHKLSLIFHPDKNAEHQKDDATEKFKILGKVHSILSDNEKRNVYIETGIYDEETEKEFDPDCHDWVNYWRNMFREVTVKDIQDYEMKYIGSDEELRDLKKAYNQCKGDMDKIYECVPFLSLKEEGRVRSIILKLIDSKELPAYDIFVNEPQSKRDRRIRKMKKEEKEAETILKKQKQKEKEKSEGNTPDALTKAIMERRQVSSENFLSALEKKYSKSTGKKKNGRKPNRYLVLNPSVSIKQLN